MHHLLVQFMCLLLLFASLNCYNSSSKYGNKTFDEWTWLTAHNAHVNWHDSRIVDAFTNQHYGLDRQLQMGVRAFMLDIDWKYCSSFEHFFGACKCHGICLCHGACSDPFKDGFHIKPFSYALSKIVAFLQANPDEVVTLFLEDYIGAVSLLQKAFTDVADFNSMVFDPYAWEEGFGPVNELQQWPKISDMVKANKRILIIDDEQRGIHARSSPGIIRSRDFLLQNHYTWDSQSYTWLNFNSSLLSNPNLISNSTSPTNLTLDMSPCYSLHRNHAGPLWHEDKPQTENANKLFLFNHFIGVKALTQTANPFTQLLMNSREFIGRRLREKCGEGTKNKRPNYIALDFIDENVYEEVIEPMNAV